MRGRLEVLLPTAVAFLFGIGTGVVIHHAVTTGRQAEPGSGPERARAAPATPAGGATAADEAAQVAEMERMLAVHEQLVEDNPDDPSLMRTVGNYRSLLGDQRGALAMYERARELQGAAAPVEERSQLLVDIAVSRAELGDTMEAIAMLEEAAALDPEDVRSRLSQAYLYLTRVMPSPPPGFDRREAVSRTESLLDEVLAIDPDNADALQFRQLIDSVRRTRPGAMPDETTAGQ